MAILLIAEHDNASLSDQTAKALSAALQIGADVDVLVAGKGARAAADQASKLKGARKVLLAEADELEQRLAEPLAALVVSLAGGYDTIVAPATASGRNPSPTRWTASSASGAANRPAARSPAATASATAAPSQQASAAPK